MAAILTCSISPNDFDSADPYLVDVEVVLLGLVGLIVDDTTGFGFYVELTPVVEVKVEHSPFADDGVCGGVLERQTA